MVSIPFIVAASGLFTLSSTGPLTTALRAVDIKPRASAYILFAGDGTLDKGWPSIKEWTSLEKLWEANLPVIKKSCAQFNVPLNSDEEIEDIKNAIDDISKEARLDPRFGFAVAMQESNLCSRAPTTANGVTNPGMMQSHNGKGSCNGPNGVLNPCPKDQIVQMIRDGILGTSDGDGLKQLIEKTGVTDSSKYYKAARMYNSGSIDSSGNLGKGIATRCYSSDISNRVLKWNDGPTECNAGEIGSLSMSQGSFGQAGDVAGIDDFEVTLKLGLGLASSDNGVSDNKDPSSTKPSIPVVTSHPSSSAAKPTPTLSLVFHRPAEPTSKPILSTSSATTTSIPSESQSKTPIATPSSTPAPLEQDESETMPSNRYYGTTANCSRYHLVQENDYCLKITEHYSITLEEFYNWNKDLSHDCKNLWLGYSYCIDAE